MDSPVSPERRNLVSAHVSSHFKRLLTAADHYAVTRFIQHYYRWCRTPRLRSSRLNWRPPRADLNGLVPFRPKDEIWFLRMRHHISTRLYQHVNTQLPRHTTRVPGTLQPFVSGFRLWIITEISSPKSKRPKKKNFPSLSALSTDKILLLFKCTLYTFTPTLIADIIAY